MGTKYNPKQYWENRLKTYFSPRGVGHLGFSDRYNAWLYRRKKHCIESFFGDVILKGKHVLDVGCGTGFFIDWYLQHGANVCGIDITETSVQKLKQVYRCEFFVQDITAPDYRPYKDFDIVNMWDVVYHIVEPTAFEQALDNISASLKEGGLWLFTDWFGGVSDVRIAPHVQARCLNTYQRLLPEKGFELVTVCPLYRTLNKQHFPILDNYLGWLFFCVDGLSKRIAGDNLSLAVWRYTEKKETDAHTSRT